MLTNSNIDLIENLSNQMLEMKELLATSLNANGEFHKWIAKQEKLPPHQQLTSNELTQLHDFSSKLNQVLYPDGKCDEEKVKILQQQSKELSEQCKAEDEKIKQMEAELNLPSQLSKPNSPSEQLEKIKQANIQLWKNKNDLVNEHLNEQAKESLFKGYTHAIEGRGGLIEGKTNHLKSVLKEHPELVEFLSEEMKFLYHVAEKFYSYLDDNSPHSQHEFKKKNNIMPGQQEKMANAKYVLALFHYQKNQYEDIYQLFQKESETGKNFDARSLHLLAIMLAKGLGCDKKDLTTAATLLLCAHASTQDNEIKIRIADTLAQVYKDKKIQDMQMDEPTIDGKVNYANSLLGDLQDKIFKEEHIETCYQLALSYHTRHEARIKSYPNSTEDAHRADILIEKYFELAREKAANLDVNTLIHLASTLVEGSICEKDLVTSPTLLLAAYLSTDDENTKQKIQQKLTDIYAEREKFAKEKILLESNNKVNCAQTLIARIEAKAEYTASMKKKNPEYLQLQRYYQLGEAFMMRFVIRLECKDKNCEQDFTRACQYYLLALRIGYPRELAAKIKAQLATLPAPYSSPELDAKISSIEKFHELIDEEIDCYKLETHLKQDIQQVNAQLQQVNLDIAKVEEEMEQNRARMRFGK
ncbi:MAG: hypothetical protein EPO11_01715 [Gammaproteobacteria bacterium]|nr:MAG: hypothetical protein EPO11_01715 [Gammaproteobacteria bacterium]